MPGKLNFSKEAIEALIADIVDGSIDKDNLPEPLYFAIVERLKKALYEGFGGSLSDFKIDTRDYELLAELRENIYMFSAAKTYQQVREMTDALTDDEGKIKPFVAFRNEALEIFNTYNVNYLRAEYNTTLGQAQSAVQWVSIEKQKSVLPYLRYSAIEDENTSEICAPLDGITLPVDDPFWDDYMPLNHFNCRCTVQQLSESDADVTKNSKLEEATNKADENIKDVFKMNPGKDGYIFKKDHPYFEVAKGDKGLAKRNFDLPIPDED
ncbi:MAG: minor capsid protein [Bacteroidetes bacterium]|nr:minor capsid protein [Bacteroidota bacterium]